MAMESPSLPLLLLGLVLFLFVFLRPRGGARGSARSSATSAGGLDAAPLRDELDGLTARLQEISREQIARMDTKMRMLNQLLAEADRKIEALKAAGGAKDAAPVPDMPAPPPRPSNPLHDRIFLLADRGMPLSEIASASGLPQGEVELILGLREKNAEPPRPA